MKDTALLHHEYVSLVNRTLCPNGEKDCIGFKDCPYKQSLIPCDVLTFVKNNNP